ncbi:MAG: iron-containing alcohol dehydrogenase [Clostridia bacterium]|nr:iron-containing alcohol dehydrogenase [Clostridia bacterium]
MSRITSLAELEHYERFADFAAAGGLTARDLIFTSGRTYRRFMEPLRLPCPCLFREDYGTGEPTDSAVNAMLAARDALQARIPGGIDRIVAVGGGSVLDMAKVLAVAPHGVRDVNDLYPDMANLVCQHEMIALPTTCGTGSEVTNISVIFRTGLGTKHGLVGDALYPARAVLVPELMEGIPWQVFASSAIDALIHAAESYLSPLATEVTESFSLEAIRGIVDGFSILAEDRTALTGLYGRFLRASAVAGLAFGSAGCGPVHALSFALGGRYHVPHGESCYQYFLPVLRYYRAHRPDGGKLQELETLLRELLGGTDGFDALAALLEQILPRRPMSAYGAVEADAADFARSTIDNQQRLLARAYVPLDYDAALAIEEECL